jgi:hypothetical protein
VVVGRGRRGDGAAARDPAATTPAATGGEATEGGVGIGQAETLRDVPFTLKSDQPVSPDSAEAYQRRALIAVQFYKEEQNPLGYPQGLEVDQRVRTSMERLRSLYPTIEFFSYDIGHPGRTESSKGLESGQYGTLAAQLGVSSRPSLRCSRRAGTNT